MQTPTYPEVYCSYNEIHNLTTYSTMLRKKRGKTWHEWTHIFKYKGQPTHHQAINFAKQVYKTIILGKVPVKYENATDYKGQKLFPLCEDQTEETERLETIK